MIDNEGWEKAPTSNSSFPKISPEVQGERDQFAQRIKDNEALMGAGMPINLPLTSTIIPDTESDLSNFRTVGVLQSADIGWEKAPKGWDKAPTEEKKKPFKFFKELGGIATGVADIAAGIGSLPISGLVSGAALPFVGKEKASDLIQKTQELLSPSAALKKEGMDTTDTGTHQILMKIISAPSEYLTQPIADAYFKLTGSPLSSAILKATLDLPAYFLAFKGAKGVAEVGARPRSIEQLRTEKGYGGPEVLKPQNITPENFAPELPFGEQRLPTQAPYNILPPELRKQLEAELNPPTEQRGMTPSPDLRGEGLLDRRATPRFEESQGQGELFTNERPYGQGELLQGRPGELTTPATSIRNRLEPFDTTLDPARPTQMGEMTERQGYPYEQTPIPRDQKTPQQMELVEQALKRAEEQLKTIEYAMPLSERDSVGEAWARVAEENARKAEQEKLNLEGISPEGMQPPLGLTPMGKGQRGAIGEVSLFPKTKQTSLEESRKMVRRDLETLKQELTRNQEQLSWYRSGNIPQIVTDYLKETKSSPLKIQTELRDIVKSLDGEIQATVSQLKQLDSQLERPLAPVTPLGLGAKGRSQSGAIRLDNMFKKKGVAQSLIDQRKFFELEKRPAAEIAKEMTEKNSPDISFSAEKASNLAIPRQVAILSQNPIIKWVVDKTSVIGREVRQATKKDIEGENYIIDKRGVEHRVPSEEGGLTKLRQLYRKSESTRKEMIEMKDIWIQNVGKDPLTREAFITDRQWETFSTMQKVLTGLLDRVNAKREANGLKPVPALSNYFPAIWEGDYFVRVKDVIGETKAMASANNQWTANTLKEKLQKQFPDHEVTSAHREKSRYDISDTSAFEEAANVLAKEGNSALAKEFNRIAADVLTHRGAGRHGIKRKFVEGFMGMEPGTLGIKQMEKAFESYITKLNNYIGNLDKAKLKSELAALSPEFQTKQKNSLEYANSYLDAARGKSLKDDWIGASVEATTRIMGLGENSVKRGVKNVSAMILPMWLTTPRQMMVNILQPTNNLAAFSKLKEMGETQKTPLQVYFEGYKEFISPDTTSVKGRNWLAREGYSDPTITHLLDFNLSNITHSSVRNTQVLKDLMKYPNARIEQFGVRIPSFHMYEKALRDSIPEDIPRFQKAAELMDNTMVNYESINKPLMYNKSGLVGDLSKDLKQYSHNAWGQFFDYMQLAKNEKELAPLSWYLSNQITMAGLKGTVMIAEATAIITAFNFLLGTDWKTPTEWLQEAEWIPDALNMGGVSTVLGYDISSSVSHPGLPQIFSMPAAQLGVGWAKDTLNFIWKYTKGTSTDADEMKAWLANTPSGPIHNWIEELYTPEGGFTPNPNKNMEGVYQRSPEEKAMGAIFGLRSTQSKGVFEDPIGRLMDHFKIPRDFSTLGEAQARSLNSATIQILRRSAAQKLGAVNAIADRIQNGEEIPSALLENYIKEGGSSRRLIQDIKSRIEDRSLSPTEQAFKRGTMTPEKAHKLEVLKNLMDMKLREEKQPPNKKEWKEVPLPNDGWEKAPSSLNQAFKDGEYGVTLSPFHRLSAKGSNALSERREYYMREAQREGFKRPETKLHAEGTNRLGWVDLDKPEIKNVDIKSARQLKTTQESTVAHEASHQDMLYGGRKKLIPFTSFYHSPISAQNTLEFSDPPSEKDNASLLGNSTGIDSDFRRAISIVSKKWGLSGSSPEEILAELKSAEALLPKGKDIRNSKIWKELETEVVSILEERRVGSKQEKVKSALSQWYLYNNSAASIPNLKRVLQLEDHKYSPEKRK